MRIPIQTHVSRYITIQFPEAMPTPMIDLHAKNQVSIYKRLGKKSRKLFDP